MGTFLDESSFKSPATRKWYQSHSQSFKKLLDTKYCLTFGIVSRKSCDKPASTRSTWHAESLGPGEDGIHLPKSATLQELLTASAVFLSDQCDPRTVDYAYLLRPSIRALQILATQRYGARTKGET
jgi:hypothetical protein